jgi:hypothetical protein
MLRDNLLDTSNYPRDHPLYSTKLTNQIGKFKDESGGTGAFLDWVFLRAKLYSMLQEGAVTVSKAKGVSLKQTALTHRNYIDQLESSVPTFVKQRRIGSANHQLFTYESSKIALSAQDDKRHWVDANDSVAYGHHTLAHTV